MQEAVGVDLGAVVSSASPIQRAAIDGFATNQIRIATGPYPAAISVCFVKCTVSDGSRATKYWVVFFPIAVGASAPAGGFRTSELLEYNSIVN